jgi:SAM-dependent methyltransferase
MAVAAAPPTEESHVDHPTPVTRATQAATTQAAAPGGRRGHWDEVYTRRGPDQVSWYQAAPQPSLDLITSVAADRSGPVIDVGGGASPLAAALADDGFTDVTVLDVSEQALDLARTHARLGGPDTAAITWIRADLLAWTPSRAYQMRHDRAVFHFLTDPADRATYLATAHTALAPGGAIVLGVFAPDGPTHCSGLPVARYDTDDLAAQLGDVFTISSSLTHTHHTPGGSPQPFTWITARRRPAVTDERDGSTAPDAHSSSSSAASGSRNARIAPGARSGSTKL